MKAKQLKECLATLPDDVDVYVHTIFGDGKGHLLRGVVVRDELGRVILQDHITDVRKKTIKSFDGNIYEVPWV